MDSPLAPLFYFSLEIPERERSLLAGEFYSVLATHKRKTALAPIDMSLVSLSLRKHLIDAVQVGARAGAQVAVAQPRLRRDLGRSVQRLRNAPQPSTCQW